MGGFVQSAMLKRSDSVSKRWSAQPGASLSRQNSVVSVRSGYGGLQGSHSMPKLEPTPGSRESSNEPASRPTSSSTVLPNLMTQGKDENDSFVKPALPRMHSRSKSVMSLHSATGEDGATSPPSSPSKRFSPTKSSWIESALTRPDSPKPTAAKNAQPSWMANIAKAKADRASVDLTPRTSTPKPAETETSRPSSPTKVTAPFGQGMLKRSDSRDLAPTPRSSTPPFMREKPQTPSQKPTTIPLRVASPQPQQQLKDGPVVEQTYTEAPTAIKPAHEMKFEAQPDIAPEPSKPTIEPITARVAPLKSPPLSTATKPKLATPPKPTTDFRSTLRSRPAADARKQDTPEFLSKFGNLRKAQTEKFVAPDVLKDNINRGKSELNKTDGPVKTVRRDELKESLLAKKEDWKTAKEEGRELPGQVHERKISGTLVTPSKPEALARKDLLGRADSNRISVSLEKAKPGTPEALARQRSLKDKPKAEPLGKQVSIPAPETAKFALLSKQASAPAEMEHKQSSETSRLAARFNPNLAGILARGPPAATSGSNAPSRSESPAVPDRSPLSATSSAPTEPVAGETLHDVRKGRAKGPKKRKHGDGAVESPALDQQPSSPAPASKSQPREELEKEDEILAPTPIHVTKPRAPPPGSAASLMMASLRGSPRPEDSTKVPEKPVVAVKSPAVNPKPAESPATATPKADVPEFSGFGSVRRSRTAPQTDDDKENTSESTLPSVKSAASFWGRHPSPKKAEAPSQILLPSKRDEEAALRSAGLLASSSPARQGSNDGLGISIQKSKRQVPTPPTSAGLPPKPARSSRIVSGQLREASPNKGM